MIVQLISWLIAQFVAAAAIWGAIRSDLRNLHRLVELERLERKEQDSLLREGIENVHHRVNVVESLTGYAARGPS